MHVRRVPAGPVELEVVEAGEGARPLLLVHGFGGAKEDFTDFADGLAERGWHAVAPDLRGHGASDRPPGEDAYDFGIFVDDLLALSATLGWERFTVLGHSMGGMVVQHLVLDHPERVSALVLMDTTHGPTEWVEEATVELGSSIVREHGMRTLMELQRDLRESDPLITPAFLRLLHEREGYGEFCDRKFLACSQDMWLSMASKFRTQADRLERLRGVDVPTLVIVGEQDKGFLMHSERMAKAIPGAELEIVPDAGHSPQFENPEAWWSALSSFLDDLPPA